MCSFSPGSFEMCFFFQKSNGLCKPEKLVVFFCCKQDQKGTGGAEIYTFHQFGEIRVRAAGGRRDNFSYEE